jgi:hypothetical protein
MKVWLNSTLVVEAGEELMLSVVCVERVKETEREKRRSKKSRRRS